MKSSWRPFLLMLLAGLSGCASFHTVETTPEGITRYVEPGDTVRVVTREHARRELLVMAINDYEIRGRVEGKAANVVWVPFDTIEVIEVERLSMRKALLTVVLPTVVAAAIICNNDDCTTRSSLNAGY
jgi:hypothetical protein